MFVCFILSFFGGWGVGLKCPIIHITKYKHLNLNVFFLLSLLWCEWPYSSTSATPKKIKHAEISELIIFAYSARPAVVTWLKYCRYGVKLSNQSINQQLWFDFSKDRYGVYDVADYLCFTDMVICMAYSHRMVRVALLVLYFS